MIGVSLGGSFAQGIPEARSILEAARRAEAAGFDALWVGDHVMMYCPVADSVTLLAAMAAVTERVRIGPCVYLLPLRHPAVTAKMFAGLDYVSGGRLVFGVGVGGEFAKEFEACGVPVRERGRRADEALEVVTRLWTEPRVTYHGRFSNFTDVALEPRPVQRPHPPIWVGGRSDAALARAARFGDGWLAYMATADRIRAGLDKVGRFAKTAGRDPSTIAGGLLLFAFVGADRDRARGRVVQDLSTRYNQPFESLVDRYCAFGTPDECADRIGKFVDAGVRNVVVKFTCTPEEQIDQQTLFAESVLPMLRGRL